MQNLNLTNDDLKVRSQRLEMRPLELSDYEAWKQGQLNRKPKQNKYDKGPPPENTLSRDYLKRWIRANRKAVKRDIVYAFAIFNKSTNEFLGHVSFGIIHRGPYQFANLGYELNNQYWGQGFAQEAVKASTHFIFKKTKLHRVEAGINVDNWASIKLCQKLGMHNEGLRHKFFWDGKQWLDLVYYSWLAEDFGIKKTRPSIRTNFGE